MSSDQTKQPDLDQEVSKEEKLEQEKAKILSCVADARLDTLTTQIAWILNHYPDTRDSDVTLQLKYWELFEPDKYDGISISPNDLYKLKRLTSISRSRAIVQNTHKLYLASEEVRKHRGTLEEEEKDRVRKAFLDSPTYSVYADESGKGADYLVVGSLWLLNGIEARNIFNDLREWRKAKKFSNEIHFAKISNSNVDRYYEILDILHKRSAAISFKAITLQRKGLSSQESALDDMFYHLIIRGIKHENDSKRAPLPRNLQFWKDAEEKAKDSLFIANLSDRLKQAATTIFSDRLFIAELFAIDSKETELMQLADLFTSSINRLANSPDTGIHVKDQFAKFFLGKFGLKDYKQQSDELGDILFIDNV